MGRQAAEETLNNLTQAYMSLGSDATIAATKRLSLLVRREANVMALGDVFFVLTILFVLLMPLTLIMRKPQRVGGGGH